MQQPPLSPEEIKEIRGRFPQRRMSELLETAKGQIPDWESGRRRPTKAQEEMLRALASGDPLQVLELLESRFHGLRRLALEFFQKNSSKEG